MTKHTLEWTYLRELAARCVARIESKLGPRARIYGVPRGGHFAALLIESASNGHIRLVDDPKDAELIVDDIIDSGTTRKRWKTLGYYFEALIDKVDRKEFADEWVVFPWEVNDEGEGAEDNVRRLLQVIGEDPDREGLLETPKRFVKALKEMTQGYRINPADHLSKSFNVEDADPEVGVYNQLIMSGPLPFTSMCEHHIALFEGHAWIAYIPDPEKGRVVGLSKLARLLDGYSQRLQVQERLTMQIANDIERVLNPSGVAVILRARHTCQCSRGVRKDGRMTTSSMKGVFLSDMNARNEFLQLVQFGG